MRSRRKVGKRRIASRTRGIFAKRVMDSRRGGTSRKYSVIRFTPLVGGRRDLRAECRAMED